MRRYFTPYTVAGHPFRLEYRLVSYRRAPVPLLPFKGMAKDVRNRYSPVRVEKDVTHLRGKTPGQLIYRGDIQPYLWLYRNDANQTFGFSMTQREPDCLLSVSPSYREGELHICAQDTSGQIAFALNSSLMLLYALNTASKGTLLVHAATVEFEGKGYLFLGRSGTGKSTHARLWLEHVKGSSLLNDDSPILRVEDNGSVFVYGSPWSGKTACYKKCRAELGGVVRLSQAPLNRIRAMTPSRPTHPCFLLARAYRWERKMATGYSNSIERIIGRCGSYHLECLPDKAAARLCDSNGKGYIMIKKKSLPYCWQKKYIISSWKAGLWNKS